MSMSVAVMLLCLWCFQVDVCCRCVALFDLSSCSIHACLKSSHPVSRAFIYSRALQCVLRCLSACSRLRMFLTNVECSVM